MGGNALKEFQEWVIVPPTGVKVLEASTVGKLFYGVNPQNADVIYIRFDKPITVEFLTCAGVAEGGAIPLAKVIA